MRLVTFEVDDTRRFGAQTPEGIVDLTDRYEGVTDVVSLLEHPDLESLAQEVGELPVTHSMEEVQVLPPIPNPGKIICIGVNYKAHREEASQKVREFPTVFSRFADTQIGHGTDVPKPDVTEMFDYEGEVAVVIGKPAWQVTKENAMDYVAGFAPYNDFSVRDWQVHTTQWLPGKNFPASGAFGPAVVTKDEIENLGAVTLTTRVNGEVRQHAPLENLIFDIPELIEYLTQFTPLAPGDIIVSGTPGGVGKFMDPPTYLQPGDVVEVEVSGMGELRNTISASSSVA